MEAGLANKMDTFPWSSHQGYISISKKWDWLHKNYILSMLSKNRKNWLRYYRRWVSVEEKGEVSEKLNGKKWPVCLGPQTFVDWIKERYGDEKISRDVPSSRELLPGQNQILEEVCSAYNTTIQEITKMRRGKMNEARNVAIYLLKRLRRDTLKEVGVKFGIETDSTISSVMERVKKRLENDRAFSRRVDKIQKTIQTS
jgi:hypothetical protein